MTDSNDGLKNITDAQLASIFWASVVSGSPRPFTLWVPADRHDEFVERMTRILAEDARLSPTLIVTQIDKKLVEQYPDLAPKYSSSIKLIEALAFQHPALYTCRDRFVFVLVEGSNEYLDQTTGETVRHLHVPVLNRICHVTI